MTKLLNWQESYSVNVREIDLQHQCFVEIINKLYSAFIDKKLDEEILPIIRELEDYAAMHFRTEESYFTKFNYPSMTEHVAEHHAFIQQIQAFEIDFKANSKGLLVKMMIFLKDWLTNHIAVSDQSYSACFNEHGLV
jgi:hemerythrin